MLTVPYPPSTNHLYCNVRGRRVLSARGRNYKQLVAMLAIKSGMKPIVGPVAVNVCVYRPRKAGDLDNTLKGLLDSLKGIAFEDDSQVVEINALRRDDKANPRAEISIVPRDAAEGTEKP